jgi:hypothetical protein
VSIVEGAIDSKGIRGALTEEKIGLLVSIVAQGLPGQSPEGIRKQLDRILDLILAKARSTKSE